MTSFLICCFYRCLVLGEFFLYLLVQNFFWMPNFGSVKNISPQCLCYGSEFSFISRSCLLAITIIMTFLMRITESPLWVSATSEMSSVSFFLVRDRI
jgi:hypothetical protein